MKRLNLKVFRIKNNLSQEDMAKKLGISKVYYCRIETGVNDPSFGLLEKFGEIFNYDDVWFLFKKSE